MSAPPSSRSVIVTYVATSTLSTLATSVIWGVTTLFLLQAGLDIFQVMIVNAAFTGGQLIFEVPTGVVADTIGRRVSYLLSLGTLIVATLLYVLSASSGWGIWAFFGASILLGLGFTFQTGAVDAWLVDALDHTGYEHPKQRVFAWGQMCSGIAMVVGTVAGGFLGQINLALPFYVRSVTLAAAFLLVLIMMRDLGFEPRPLRVSTFGDETRRILRAGVTFGWRNPVVRALLFVSLVSGAVLMFGFYSWQRYFLDLLGRDLVWVNGVVAAGFGLASVGGNLLVKPLSTRVGEGPAQARLLAWLAAFTAATMLVIGVIGVLTPSSARGIAPFVAVVAVYWLSGVLFGVAGPIRQAYINRQIPSAQRATVLSLDSFFSDGGAVVGQTGLGYMSKAVSIPVAWVVSGVIVAAAAPFYRRAARAETGE